MDRFGTLMQELAAAEILIASYQKQIDQQQEVISALKRHGDDLAGAEEILSSCQRLKAEQELLRGSLLQETFRVVRSPEHLARQSGGR